MCLLVEGNSSPPDIGLSLVGVVPFRPLGKSNLVPAPYADASYDDYIPSVMTTRALKIGYEKSLEDAKYLDEDLMLYAKNSIIKHMKSVWTLSPEEYVMSYEEAIAELTLDKSPGYPYYYDCPTKQVALDKYGDEIRDRVEKILQGVNYPCVFALTLKSELRPKAKVEQDKTRIFCASDIHHLLASTMLYGKMNQNTMDSIGDHPITIGIQMPGPQYVNALKKLVVKTGKANDGDESGCDQRYPLPIARNVRDIKHAFLPLRYYKAGCHIYNTVYAGVAVILGGAFRVFGNKSGWKNTGDDNSLQLWFCLIMAARALYPAYEWYEVWAGLINGDDLVTSMLDEGFSFFHICEWLKVNVGVYIEADNYTPRAITDCVYLSHHLEYRHVEGFGDFLVAAGNWSKLMSSINWVKTNPNLSFEESSVAHLVGLRMCLFPWQVEFERIDALLTDYLKRIQKTQFIRDVLVARFGERELARLHTRVESFNFLSSTLSPLVYQVLKGIIRLIN